MAAKKHKKKVGAKKRTHRRRVGAHGKIERVALMGVGVAVGGALAPFIINAGKTALGTSAASMPGWMIPGGVVLLGAGVMYAADGTPIGVGFGAGLLAVGAVEVANEMGLNEPGISGLSSGNNAPPGSRTLSNAVGCQRGIAGGPDAYLNTTVGAHSRRHRKAMAVGALISD